MLRVCSDISKLLKNALFFDWLEKTLEEAWAESCRRPPSVNNMETSFALAVCGYHQWEQNLLLSESLKTPWTNML